MDRLTISLAEVEVRDDSTQTRVGAYTEESLAALLNQPGTAEPTNDARQVTGGRRAILHVLLKFATMHDLPSVLNHRIRYSFLKLDGSEVEATVSGGMIKVARESEALTIGAPLEGIWQAGRGVSEGLSGHRGGAIRPQNGIPYQKARYAIDFTAFDTSGNAFTDQRTLNEDWVGYGSPVLAVADARVVDRKDDAPDSKPFDPDVLQGLTGETLAGNYVVLDLGHDMFAYYGHFQPGSIVVSEGDRVRKGDILGRVGNSGNSTLPHLHFQINRSIPRSGEAIPYVFESYEFLGEAGFGWWADWEQGVATGLDRVLDRTVGEHSRPEEEYISELISDTIRAAILKGMRGHSKDATPDWTRALTEGGVPHLNEIPGEKAIIRFPTASRE